MLKNIQGGYPLFIRQRLSLYRQIHTPRLYDGSSSRRKEKLTGFLAFKKIITSVLDNEVEKRKHTWKSRLPDLQLKYDPREIGGFDTFGVSPLVVQALNQTFPEVKDPTETQKKILSVLGSGFSVIAKETQGSGKSFSALLHALSRPRALTYLGKPATTTLILVKTSSLARQYELQLLRILDRFDGETAKVAQFLYRCNDKTEEKAQLEKWKTLEPPHIIVATPQRLLDAILESGSPNGLGLSDLRLIICDDAEFLFVDGATSMAKKKNKKKKPAESVMNYLLELRDSERDPKLGTPIRKQSAQMAFFIDTMSSEFIQMLQKRNWVNWENLKMVGVSAMSHEKDGKELLLPSNVKVSAVIASESGDLEDLTPFDLDNSEELHSDIGYLMDLNYKKHRVYLKSQSRGDQEATRFAKNELLPRIMENLSGQVLLLHDESESSIKVQKQIEAEGFYSKIFNLHDDFSNFFHPGFQDFSPENPHVLISNVQNVIGLTFKNLQNIVCLGVDTFIDPRSLAMLGGRFRPASGLVKLHSNNGSAPNLVFVFPKSDFGYIERKAFERSLLKIGGPVLVPLTKTPETGFDKSDYKDFFDDIEDTEAIHEVY
ncbi:unnamed protein product [Kuraishia capsulata CBS 1993]|uniref:ATP-dependent RNA helicase n=1 Tax=Kuraishia capsulata CBS 1993 TaxID=1382522 RepID=W6MGX6_9ASCO|nr:uncharacterized protein KUCA_T00001118001 [Kuraishia capsulata CBS 1993]CDK25151.1 unnamed protein product [Kuraishia capsulata CBS 1993]